MEIWVFEAVASRRELELRRHPIGIGLIERDRHEHVDDALCHGPAANPGFKEAHTKR
jgi:hypothetical protein